MYTKEHIRSLLSSNDQIIFDQIDDNNERICSLVYILYLDRKSVV